MKLTLKTLNCYTTPAIELDPSLNLVAFQIDKQEGFVHDKDYVASNGLTICSSSHPAWDGRLWLKGKERLDDNIILVASKVNFARITAAIEEILDRENSPKIPPKVVKKAKKLVTFFYRKRDGEEGRRLIEVESDDGTYLKGKDLDKNEDRTFLKSRIVGAIKKV